MVGGVGTLLKFPGPVDASRTELLGWEGRFEPMVIGGPWMVISPLHDLARSDRFLLLVTLKDGSAIPLTVRQASEQTDGQVNVFMDPRTPEAMRQALEEKTRELEELKAENRREGEHGVSVDHALATLLARNQIKMSPFMLAQTWFFHEDSTDVEVRLFLSRKPEAKGKLGVVFEVTNRDTDRTWQLKEVRLTTLAGRQPKPFAIRAVGSAIAPGERGQVAVVADLNSLNLKTGDETLVFELFRDGGLRQAMLQLAAKDVR